MGGRPWRAPIPSEDAASMTVSIRAYREPDDYQLVDRFLIETYQPGDHLATWLQPRWEYMHGHPFIENVDLSRIGIVEDATGVLGVVHPEHHPALCYLQVRPGRVDTVPLLADWAETHLGGWSFTFGAEGLGFYVDDTATDTGEHLAGHGYVRTEYGESDARLDIHQPLPEPGVPAGFRLQSLADENDLTKLNRVLWRGFDHEGPPPDDQAGRMRSQQTPNYRKDLNIVAMAPDGTYAAYAGIWVVPENGVAMVEPVATDPAFRRMGLGRAAVLEAVRRAADLGAAVAWVGSDLPFYLEMGFEIVAHSTLWWRPRG
jgi:predicted N-acetyltransferase YhbS